MTSTYPTLPCVTYNPSPVGDCTHYLDDDSDDSIKRLRILVGINSLVSTTQPAYSNHMQFFFRLGRSHPDIDFILFNPSRMSIDRMRNTCAKIAIEQDCDYLLFLDDDVLIPIDALAQLLRTGGDVVAGNVIIRGYPFENMFFEYSNEKTDLKPMTEESYLAQPPIFNVDAVGFSLCLIKVDILRQLPAPFFVTGLTNTEDIYFCLKAKKYFPSLTMYVIKDLTCAHILWSETISSENKQLYKSYYESQNPDCLKKDPELEDDRGDIYYDMINKIVLPEIDIVVLP